MAFDAFGLLLDTDSAVRWRRQLRDEGRTLVFTNGCFDVLHAGHVEHLAWARGRGDALLVGLNEDASVRALKGTARPIVPFAQRTRVLLALRSVDAVVGFAERTPERLLDLIRPDVHVKSDQYRADELPERAVIEAYGGRIELTPHVSGISTTDTIARIVDAYCIDR